MTISSDASQMTMEGGDLRLTHFHCVMYCLFTFSFLLFQLSFTYTLRHSKLMKALEIPFLTLLSY